MVNRQIDKKVTKQVRVRADLHWLLKKEALIRNSTIQSVIENWIMENLAVDHREYEQNR